MTAPTINGDSGSNRTVLVIPITSLRPNALVEIDGFLYCVDCKYFSFGAPVVRLCPLEEGHELFFAGSCFGPVDPPVPYVLHRPRPGVGWVVIGAAAERLGK